MKVRKENLPAEPSYPEAKELFKYQDLMKAAILGAGIVLGGCDTPTRTTGVPLPSPEKPKAESCSKDQTKPSKPKHTRPKSSENGSPRVPGKPPVSPKSDEHPVKGKFRVEPRTIPEIDPPRMMGAPPVPPNYSPEKPAEPTPEKTEP